MTGRCLPAAVMLMLAMGACVPVPLPHHSINAPRFSGRVIDAASRRPLPRATVELRGLADSRVETDAAGRFTTGLSRTLHVAGLYAYDDGMRLQLPPARRTDGTLMVTHPGYRRAEVRVNCLGYPRPFEPPRAVSIEQVKEVRLQRR